MRRLFLPLALLLASACSSAPTGFYTATYSETQTCIDAGAGLGMTCSGSVPTSVATGAGLAWIDSYRLRICAPASQSLSDGGTLSWTISDAGVMQAYLCDQLEAQCYRAGGLDQAVTVKGSQCLSFTGPLGPDVGFKYITDKSDTLEFVASGVILTGSFNADAGLVEEILTHRQQRQ